jgi:hypothetical protein
MTREKMTNRAELFDILAVNQLETLKARKETL